MRSWCALLSALALGLLVLVSGCGQSSRSVAPGEVPNETEYEADYEERVGIDGRPVKQQSGSDKKAAEESAGEGEAETASDSESQ